MAKYFKNWGKTRSVAFWICCAVAVLSIVGAVYYIITINGLIGPSGSEVDIFKWSAVWCVIAGVVAFIVLSLFNLANYGAAAMGILDLVAFCLMLSPSVVSYVSSNMMAGEYVNDPIKIPGLIDLIISGVLLVVSAVLSNVFAWVHLKKKSRKKKKDAGANGGNGGNGTLQQKAPQQPAYPYPAYPGQYPNYPGQYPPYQGQYPGNPGQYSPYQSQYPNQYQNGKK